ncbi:MAG: DNA primase [Coleofasciculaceae cyanobacterium]
MEIPRLHPETIEEVKQRVDIVDVISEHVVLRKRGKEYVGLCPFHEEKSPSFTVNSGKQLYHCFGCGSGGNAIKFLMEVGKTSFAEVVFALAQRYQVPVQTLEPEQRQELQRQLSEREQLYEILALAAAFYQHALRRPQGQVALDYLLSQRRLSEKTISQFQLGYAPGGWDTVYRYLVEQKNKPSALVKQAGLIKVRRSGNGYYDAFRDRLMIPINDYQGRVIAFGGRTLNDQEQPKYLNSPETPLFDKSKTLFALDKARNAISKEDQAVVVEGYFDVIALHAAGITNVVASLGTALSKEQVRQLLRYTESKQIVLNFDADKAGTNAAERVIGETADLAYKGLIQLRVINLPEGKDADQFLQEHSDASAKYRQLLNTAPLWLDWQLNQLLIGKDTSDSFQFQQVANQMLKLLNQLQDSTVRPHYVNYCAQLLSQGDSRLVSMYASNLLAQLKKPQLRSAKSKDQKSPLTFISSSEHSLLEKSESLLLSIYLHYPEYRQAIIDALEAKDLIFSLPPHRFLWQQILKLQPTLTQHQGETPDPLISELQDCSLEFPEQMKQVAHLFHLDEKGEKEILPDGDYRGIELIKAAAACMERVIWEKQCRCFLELWKKADPATNAGKRQEYCEEFYNAKQRIKELDRKLQFSYFYR